MYDAVVNGDITAVGEIARGNPQALFTHVALRDDEQPFAGNSGDLLTFAIARCDAQMLGALLELGADPDGTPLGLPLTYAALADDPTMATMLLQAGASPDARAREASTPLMEVLYYKRADAVRLLAQGGADVNRADEVGATPLESALLFKDYESAKELMRAGANPWLVGNKATTPAYRMAEAIEQGESSATLRSLVEQAQKDGAFWPPASPEEVRRKFLSGVWPTAEMKSAGYVAGRQAMESLKRMDTGAR